MPVFTPLQKLAQASSCCKTLVEKLAIVPHCPASNGDDVGVNVDRGVRDDKVVTLSKQRRVARVEIPWWPNANRFGRKYFRAFYHGEVEERELD